MAMYPKIQSPCPYLDRRTEMFDGDVCRMCLRQVFDLTAMADAERAAFLAGCEGEVCVSYKAPLRIALAAMAASAAVAMPMAAAACDDTELTIVMGGIRDPAHTEYVQDAGDAAIPVLPIVYEGAQASEPSEATAATTRVAATTPAAGQSDAAKPQVHVRPPAAS